MKSLYSICLETVADHADCISEWIDIPLDPFVLDILQVLGQKESRIKPCIYEGIGAAHGIHLPNHLGTVSLIGHDTNALRRATQLIPKFITHLNLSHMDGINDQTILLVKPCIHLKVLDVSHARITDLGVSHLARMSTTPGLLNHLQILGLSANKISDMCLKYLVKMSALTGVDLSYTNVTDVAIQFMKQHQFEVLYAVSPPSLPLTKASHSRLPYPYNVHLTKINQLQQEDRASSSLITWHDAYGVNNRQKRTGVQYLDRMKQQKNPAYNIMLNTSLFTMVGVPLPPLRHRGQPIYGCYFDDLCFVRPMKSTSTITTSIDEKRKKKNFNTSISGPRKKRPRISKDRSPSPSSSSSSSSSSSIGPTRKQSWPNVMDYLKMVEKDLGI